MHASLSPNWAEILTVLAAIVFAIAWLATLFVLTILRNTRKAGIALSVVTAGFFFLSAFLWFWQKATPTSVAPDGFSTASRRNIAEHPIDLDAEAKKNQKDRPKWVDAKPELRGEVYHANIVVGPYSTRQECQEKMPAELRRAANRYVAMCLDASANAEISPPADQLRAKIVKEQWEETRQHSVGPMLNLHVRLEFNRGVKDWLLGLRRDANVEHRLLLASVGFLIVLGLLTGLFAYLKISKQ